MGDFRVRKLRNVEERKRMYQYAIEDIKAFELMLKENVFVEGNIHIGAEQELCLVDENYSPATTALDILNEIDDEHYTNELALFNLEVNLDPLPLKGKCFSTMENDLIALLEKGQIVAGKYKTKILQAGILPTLMYPHLDFKYMTPEPRYEAISHTLAELRGRNFEIHMQGVDEFIMSLGSVLFEACNTSFQLHLQIDANDFVDKHNWSQMIAGPVLSGCTNSPLLFGHELWSETRIGLFKQSLDTRTTDKYMRSKVPRVYFGNKWLSDSAAELWKDDLMRFPLLFTSDDLKNSLKELEKGNIPDLRAIRLHNGTTYTWNRLCYGASQKTPHLRIECRYLPSGPSSVDEIANFVFWIGLMIEGPERGPEFWKELDFSEAKANFIKASRAGLDTIFNWFDKKLPADKLILDELIPMAYRGLNKANVDPADIDKYLGIITRRIKSRRTGSSWIVINSRNLNKTFGQGNALKSIVKKSLEYQEKNLPVNEWEHIEGNILDPDHEYSHSVGRIMTRDVFCVNEDVSLELVKSFFDWHNIHHLPIENIEGDMVGIITDGMIKRMKEEGGNYLAKDIMLKNVISISPQHKVKEACELMKANKIYGLPVTINKKLVGIVTRNDIQFKDKDKDKD